MGVSRHFHYIVEPILYREVVFTNAVSVYDFDQLEPFHTLRRLARTIVSRPELGHLIQILTIHSLDTNLCDSDFATSDLSRDIAESRLEHLTNDFRADYHILLDAAGHFGLRNGLILSGYLGQLILLLHHLPRLKKFNAMDVDYDIRFIALSSLGAFAGGIPAGLKSISELSICFSDYGELNGGEVVPFMALPSLTSFTIQNLAHEEYQGSGLRIIGLRNPDTHLADGSVIGETLDLPLQHSSGILGVVKSSDGYTLVPRSSSITHLEFVSSDVSCRFLADVLMAPAALEHFRYEFGRYPMGNMPFVPSEFLPALLTQAESLKTLIINTKPDYIRTENPLIGSLATFRALERLVVPFNLLLNYEDGGSTISAAQYRLDALLPPSLVHLQLNIEWWKGETLAGLFNATGIPKTLPTTARHIPTLSKVVIGPRLDSRHVREAVIAEASRICPQIVLEFQVSATSRPITNLIICSDSFLVMDEMPPRLC